MRWVLGLVLLFGCGPLPAPQPVNNARDDRTSRRVTGKALKLRVPRPEIDVSAYLPDFHDELRWPLSGMSHPVLEPRFPIAQELAIGVEWRELCARGVHARFSTTQKELLSYLHAWCDVLRRDIDSACAHLRPLLGSYTRGLTAAVRQDLANILASDGSQAEHWLNRHGIRDTATLDLVAATLVEVGSDADAAAINRLAIDSDLQAPPATKCRRLTKRIVLGTDADPMPALEELRTLATQPKLPDPQCAQAYDKVTCWKNPQLYCMRYHQAEGIDRKAANLLDAYFGWPYEGYMNAWWRAADDARLALPLDGAAELAVTAFEASMRADPTCHPERAMSIQVAADDLRRYHQHESYAARLQPFVERCAAVLPAAQAAP